MQLFLQLRYCLWRVIHNVDAESVRWVDNSLNSVERPIYDDIFLVWQIGYNYDINHRYVSAVCREAPIVLFDLLDSFPCLLDRREAQACLNDRVPRNVKVTGHVEEPEHLNDRLWEDDIQKYRNDEICEQEKERTPL